MALFETAAHMEEYNALPSPSKIGIRRMNSLDRLKREVPNKRTDMGDVEGHLGSAADFLT